MNMIVIFLIQAFVVYFSVQLLEGDFEAWLDANSSQTAVDTLSLKRRVAFACAAALAGCIVLFLGIKSAYLRSLHDFQKGVRFRREQHMAYDLGRIAREAELLQDVSS